MSPTYRVEDWDRGRRLTIFILPTSAGVPLHNHVLPALGDVCHRLLDQLPHPSRHCARQVRILATFLNFKFFLFLRVFGILVWLLTGVRSSAESKLPPPPPSPRIPTYIFTFFHSHNSHKRIAQDLLEHLFCPSFLFWSCTFGLYTVLQKNFHHCFPKKKRIEWHISFF